MMMLLLGLALGVLLTLWWQHAHRVLTPDQLIARAMRTRAKLR